VRLQEIIVEVSGMQTGDDERALTAALDAVPGVHAVRVDIGEGRAIVTGDAGVADPNALRAAIGDAGYEAGEVWFAE